MAGCQSFRGSDSTTVTESSTTTTTPTASATSETTKTTTTRQPCENGGELVEDFVVKYNTLGGFDLTTTKERIAVGDQITFRLENVTDEDKVSGVKSKYTIHRKTAKGWRDIFYAPDSEGIYGYHDLGMNHPPGDGFTWELTFNQSGLAHDIEGGMGSLDVCTPLQSGTYRFVYWGVSGEQEIESEKEYALGIRFTVFEG